ncbi:alpha/beta hydrolase [Deinococcus cavernae]|uniref:Alpha/beta hydrolase n=1 Tax=Deinococcus cavernae TaxID=2320857 RepID=A0A418VEQ7_9DEIO|nr:alpha/beta hydrolase [Deinococcus cavernae]RJF74533.1 alpha/beta hydrolase [Deinococcus cavernae]
MTSDFKRPSLQLPSLQMRLMGGILRTQPKRFDDAEAFRRDRLNREPPQAAPIPDSLQLQAYISHERLGEQSVFTLQPKWDGSDWHIVYLHGGAYAEELVSPHWAIIEALLHATGATITVPLYPLAPEHTHREAFEFLNKVNRRVLARTPSQRCVWCGDSAGGGLALAFVQHCRDAGLPLPAHLILFSPWLDVTLTNPEIAAIEPRDPTLSRPGTRVAGEWWAGGSDPRSPLVSPLYGNSEGLPPIMIYQGTADILLPDVRRYVQQARQEGVDVRLHEFRGAFHVFMAATFTPEAKQVYAGIRRLLGTEEHIHHTAGLVKLISWPPIKIAMYMNERARQRHQSRTGDRQTSVNPLAWLAALAALLVLRRRRSRRKV